MRRPRTEVLAGVSGDSSPPSRENVMNTYAKAATVARDPKLNKFWSLGIFRCLQRSCGAQSARRGTLRTAVS
eukprot:scaffold870_cov268-Pinguiococcus_pyrenoidosus.AAC.39